MGQGSSGVPLTVSQMRGGTGARGEVVLEPAVSIIIPAKNEQGNLPRCLQAVQSQEFAGTVEILVIDSGSSDDTAAIASRMGARVHNIAAAEFHHARTRNLGAELTTGRILVYLAADAFPAHPGWLQALVQPLAEQAVSACYGRHLPKPQASPERVQALHQLYPEQPERRNAHSRAAAGFRYYHFSTVNAALRRKVWEQTPFPSDCPVFEDMAIAKRLLDAGHTVAYEPKATVYHSHDYPAWVLFRRYYDLGVTQQRLQLLDDAARANLWKQGWPMLHNKLGGGISAGALLRACFHDGIKACGLWLGQRERWLPPAVRRRFSLFHLS